MINEKDFESIDDVVAQLLAQEVAHGFEMARMINSANEKLAALYALLAI